MQDTSINQFTFLVMQQRVVSLASILTNVYIYKCAQIVEI